MSQDYEGLIQELQSQLEVLQKEIALQVEPSPSLAKNWWRSHREIQAFFQSQIINTELEVTPANLSLQVELDKQLKMLGVDLSMLQTARNPATWEKRYQQASDRFGLLKKYCEMHLN
ncbi:MAG: heterocyst frequency control protein PatD [Pseudanabaena sp.]